MELIRFDGETMSAIRQLTRAFNGESKKEIDWEQRRYEIAKDILAAQLSKSDNYSVISAVKIADKLIAELKKQPEL